MENTLTGGGIIRANSSVRQVPFAAAICRVGFLRFANLEKMFSSGDH
jgi:hypothetical protein